MTYCLAIRVSEGLAFASDTRSNAGVDYVTAYKKLHVFSTEPDRVVVMLSAGSLATTQEIVARIGQDLTTEKESLNSGTRLYEVAAYVGRVSQFVQKSHQEGLAATGASGSATFIVGGQVKGEEPNLFMVYPEGNFISVSDDTPYLQIGETKYGKPMLDRIVDVSLSLDQAIRLALLSLDATIRSNVTVGPPLDLGIYRADSFAPLVTGRLDIRDDYYQEFRTAWNEALVEAFRGLPDFKWPEIASGKIEG